MAAIVRKSPEAARALQPTVPATQLALVRHGRSAHVHRGWIDHGGFNRWRMAYEEAGLVDAERAPAELVRLAGEAGLVVCSDAPRAVASARLLAPGREITASPLLRELELRAPDLGRLRLPLLGWAFAVGLGSLLLALRPGYPPASERARIAEAAEWLADLAARHRFVVAVTHASLRRQLAIRLVGRGWRAHGERRSLRHWSAWLLSAAPAASQPDA